MSRFIFLAFALHLLPTALAIAEEEEYVLRLDTIGYPEIPATVNDPKETVLRSIEVLACSESSFHGSVNIGKQALTLSGKLRTATNGEFNVRIRYAHSIDKGESVLSEDGKRKPSPRTTTVETNVTIAVDNSMVVGGLESKTNRSGLPVNKSKIQYVLTLAKYEPTGD